MLANQLQGQGHLQEAEHYLQYILRQQPAHPFALHLLGVIAFQVGKLPLAAELIQLAIRKQPGMALFHANMGEICRRLGQPDAAILHGEEATRLEPRMVMAQSNLGIAYFDRKDYTRAEACQQRALATAPDFAPALNNMGCIKRDVKRPDVAVTWFRRAIEADPRYLEPLNNLGALLLEQGQLEAAQAALEKALQLDPGFPDAVCNLGGVHLEREGHAAALACFQRALALRPAYTEAQLGLAKTLQALERLPEAEAAALLAVQQDPGNAAAHGLLGSIYSAQEQVVNAEEQFRQALALDPYCDAALIGQGYLCMEAGALPQAEDYFLRVLEQEPDNLSAHIHLTQVKKVRPGDSSLTALLEQAREISRLAPNKAIALEFALGKAFDDIRDHDHAFAHFSEGCRRKRQSLHHDAENTSRLFTALTDIFSKEYIDSLRSHGNSSTAPVFVLGMPRSGTTLTEQIIASHPEVRGRGEVDDLLKIAERERSIDGRPLAFPYNLQALDAATLKAWGTDYVTGMLSGGEKARRVTDKMPANYFVIGLIHLMLPNAKIIHVQRNPVDNCLSCFTNLFRAKQEYTYDLAELGRYYADYARLMAHWRRVLPAGAFLDIRYEDIVADQEAAARRLLAFCDLEWDAACLDFHANKRAIRTASITQVRQPIYGTSVERWRSYEKFLGPLLDTLGELAAAG